MLYPLYVWKDSNSAYGATFPDLVGVNTAADSIEQLNWAAQEAVELMYDDGSEIPAPSAIEHWTGQAEYAGGFWMLVDIHIRIPRGSQI